MLFFIFRDILTLALTKKERSDILKQVYILLSRTGSVPSKAIQLFTRKKYTHSSISVLPYLDGFYSYGRRRLHNFLVGGFVSEDINNGVFAKYSEGECELFSLDVSDESYFKIKKLIEFYIENYDKCKYNFRAIVPMCIGIKQKLKFKMTCSQFVATLLELSGACALPRHPSLMQPVDFLKIKGIHSIYKGKIKNCHFPDTLISIQ